jgi:hypothetical protein
MNRDVCGQCDAPVDLCRCAARNPIRNTWAVLREVVELVDAPASLPFAACVVAWLLTRDDRRAMTKHLYRDAGVAEETARRIMDHLRDNGWAESRPVPTDKRVVRLFPSKKILEALNGI